MIQITPTKLTTSERSSAIHFLRWKAKASLKLEEARTKPTISQTIVPDETPLSKSIEKYRKLFRDVVSLYTVPLGQKATFLRYRTLQALQTFDPLGPVLFHPAVQLPRPT